VTDSEILARILVALDELADVVRINNALAMEVLNALKQPASNDLPDLLVRIVTQLGAIQAGMVALPAEVARAVSTGEVA
jgi:hypothetical protein